MIDVETELEFCPSCADFKVISERTGFCSDCDGKSDRCENCGGPSDAHGKNRPNAGYHKYCSKCRYEFWLTKFADDIERYMAIGKSFVDAKLLVRRDNDHKLNCLSCGEEMKPASNGQSFFCGRTIRCKTAHRRLKYLAYNRIPRLTKETALKQVLEELE